MGHLAVHIDPLASQLRKGALEAAVGFWVVARVGVTLRRDDQETRRSCSVPLADLCQERFADHRLVRDHEHVLLLRAAVARDEMLDRYRSCSRTDPIDDLAPQPAGLLLGMGRD